MQDEKNDKFTIVSQTKVTDSFNEEKSDIELKAENEAPEETKAKLQEDSTPGFFHITRRYKWIFSLSLIILLVTGILIYAKVNNVLGAEYWQMAIWGVCVLLSLYSIFKKSLAALILNLILFFGISLLPAWGLVYQFFKPILELLLGTKLPEWRQPHYW